MIEEQWIASFVWCMCVPICDCFMNKCYVSLYANINSMVCACACVCVCVHACVCMCVRVCICSHVYVCAVPVCDLLCVHTLCVCLIMSHNAASEIMKAVCL